MGVQARLAASEVDVEPGGSATVRATIRNVGHATDRFRAEIVQGTVAWAAVSPSSLSLLPFEEGTVTITFSPPREAGVEAGPTGFTLRLTSEEDPADNVVERGTVNVGAFSDVTAELVPRSTRGRRVARAQVAVHNRSNVPYRAELSGSEPDMALGVSLSPQIVEVEPGKVAFSRVTVRVRHSVWRGPAVSHDYSVFLREAREVGGGFFGDEPPTQPVLLTPSPPGQPPVGSARTVDAPQESPPTPTPTPTPAPTPVAAPPPEPRPIPRVHPSELTVEGTMLQEAVLPQRTGLVSATVIGVVVLGLLAWFALVRPEITSTVRSQVRQQLAASGITPSPTSGTGKARSNGTVTGSPNGTGGLTVNGSLLAAGNGTEAYTVPNGKTLQITDLLLQNAAGDTGVVSLGRNDTILMEWSMANFRDLDYHWITPIVIGPGDQLQLMTSGCTDTCTPGLYYAGNLVSAGS